MFYSPSSIGLEVALNFWVPTCWLLPSKGWGRARLLEYLLACITPMALTLCLEPMEFAEWASPRFVCVSVPRIGEFVRCPVFGWEGEGLAIIRVVI